MRDLKLRAWDVESEYMDYIDDLYWFEESGVHNVEDYKASGHFSDYKFMQCTGLTDINGKDIYEGDICTGEVKGFNSYPQKVYGVIIYHQPAAAYGIISAEDFEAGKGTGCSQVLIKPFLRVVGNIYEHRWLLHHPI